MPCTYTETEEEIRQRLLRQKKVESNKVGSSLENSLCDLLTAAEEKGIKIPESLLAWWDSHTRGEAERIKKEALSKLSPRERRLLGLEEKTEKKGGGRK